MRHVKLFENFDDLENEVNLFVKQYSGSVGKEEWGEDLQELRYEMGACAMVSETLCEYLKSDGFNCKTITEELKKHRKEGFGYDGTHHTAVLVDGKTVVDLTINQFDKHASFPLIISVEEWKKML